MQLDQTGFGKRTSSYEYRVTGRGGSGIVAIGMGKKNSAVIASFPVEESDDLMLISDAGQTIRVAISGVSIQGRAAQGVAEAASAGAGDLAGEHPPEVVAGDGEAARIFRERFAAVAGAWFLAHKRVIQCVTAYRRYLCPRSAHLVLRVPPDRPGAALQVVHPAQGDPQAAIVTHGRDEWP